jgi:predicted kinase
MDRTPTLHFFCGKAGAGKTTVASGLATDHSSILLSEDIWLLELYGDEMKTFDDYIRVSKKLKAVVGPLTVDLLRSGQSVVLDFQANTRAGRSWFRSLFEQASAGHVLHFVNTPEAVCLERIARRNVERPPGSHHLTDQDFVHISSFFQPPEEAEGFNVKEHTA